MGKFLRNALWTIVTLAVVFLAVTLTPLAFFPYAGGEYHAVFSLDGGSISSALWVYTIYSVTAGGTLWALLVLGLPLPWLAALGLTTLVTGFRWSGFFLFPDASHGLRLVVGALMMLIPLVLALVSLPAIRAIRRPNSQEARHSFPRSIRTLALVVLALPYVLFALGWAVWVGYG